jgi:methyltransferase (TIGR00027 family)
MRADRPSATAILITAATVFLARDPRVADLVPPGAAELCVRCLEAVSPLRRAAVDALATPALRWAARLAERATIPGLLLHFLLRKRWIEEAVRAGLAEGCEEVVVVGAGFDTLAARLAPEFPRVQFVEIDHPATQHVKQAVASADNLRLIAADLARVRLQDVFAAGPRAVFVIEGLLMYLREAEIAPLFSAVTRRVVFTQMEPAPDGRSRFHNATPLVRGLLRRWREPFRTALAREDASRFLGRFGLRLLELVDTETLRARYLAPSGRRDLALARGELVVVAER